MRVRRVQEQDLPDLPARLQAARKASDHSLLEICRRLEITPTYWYKLEKEEASTISYELLTRIEGLLSVDFGVRFFDGDPISHDPNNLYKDAKMNLSKLQWIKVVTPPPGWEGGYWAYNPEHLSAMQKDGDQIINQNGITIFSLGFKHETAARPKAGDLMLLAQHAKITHIVEILDEQPVQQGGWFGRYVKVNWWQPTVDWQTLPQKGEILGCDIDIFDGHPHRFDVFKKFQKAWENRLDLFQAHVAEQLSESLAA
jgi:transcriptional regulator with XRE-family HTH domain